MNKFQAKKAGLERRKRRVRGKVTGTADRPRLTVHRTNAHIYAQVIDDVAGNTLASASTLDPQLKDKLSEVDKKGASKLVGQLVAERAKAKGITSVVFDRGGYVYTGRVKEVADGARAGGLDF